MSLPVRRPDSFEEPEPWGDYVIVAAGFLVTGVIFAFAVYCAAAIQ